MKRGSKPSFSNRVEQMSTRQLITTILVLVALITLLILIALVIGQIVDGGEEGIGWIIQLGVVFLEH